MKTVIINASTHGTTERAATILNKNLGGDVQLIDLKKTKSPRITDFEAIIIGGSIHVGTMQSKVTKFIKNNVAELMSKKLGLFLCCMYEDEKAEEQFNLAYPEELRNHSVANGLFGGEFIFAKMNFFEKAILKKVKGVTEDVSNLDELAIKQFAEKFQEKA